MQIGILNFNTAEEIRPGKCLNNKVLQVLLTTDEITKRALSEKVLIPVNCVFVVARRGYSETIILKEVYRMDQGLPLQETWFGTWNVRSGLKATPHSLMKRRSNFHGYLITATAMDFPPLVLMKEDENNLTGGLFGVVWKILEKRLNFRTVFKIPDERTWGVYHSNNTTTGMVDMLHSGKVEVAVFNMLMTSRRSLVMDFSIPLLNPA
ncbi:hypothetical protein C0J52_13894 [Blattella germanica]|nr:hypothetical protein C0J52_13894 [Blattella germanica]